MNKTKRSELLTTDAITVTVPVIADYLGCGRATADRIAQEAHAKIYIGRRVLVNVAKVKAYIDSISE